MSFIRKYAFMDNPVSCVRPSIIAFLVLAAWSFVSDVVSLLMEEPSIPTTVFALCCLVVSYLLIPMVFIKVTREGFTAMEA